MRNLNPWVFCVCWLALLGGGCGGGEVLPESDPMITVIDGQGYSVIRNDGLSSTYESLSGRGAVVFSSVLGDSPALDQEYLVQFSLEDGGSLTLTTFAEAGLENGVRVTYRRSGEQLVVLLPEASLSYKLEHSAEGVQAFRVRIRNSTPPARVLTWPVRVERRNRDAATDRDGAELDPKPEYVSSVQAKTGQGIHYGVELDGATLLQLDVKSRSLW